ncbi:MAG TPA: permease-like cell division protein FtsX [Myxococcaceae bacterium]|nr:permease-like cell division protein FtsX [Myxococcaceae bacterium]
MSSIAKAAYFCRAAVQGVRRRPFIHLVAVVTISVVLFAAGLARGAAQLVDSLISVIGGDAEVTVYLQEGANEARAGEIASALALKTNGSAVVVPPDAAMERLRRELGALGDVLQDLPRNPLPYSIQIQLPAERRTPQELRSIAAEARRIAGVASADFGEEAVSRLSAIARALRYGGLVAFAIVAFATVFIVSATLQLAIYSRREEIEIQKLVGATDRFVKAPFLIEGALQGLLGAAVAILALWMFAAALGPKLIVLFSFLVRPGETRLSLLTPSLVWELLAVGCALGLGGSFAAVGRFLRP